MRQKHYLIFLGLQFLNIIWVIMVFRLLEDKKIASLLAGLSFVLFPIYYFWTEYKINRFQRSWWWIFSLQFWVFFAVPIFLTRILNWSAEFNDLSIFGVSARNFHGWANSSFMAMSAITIMAWLLPGHQNKKEQSVD